MRKKSLAQLRLSSIKKFIQIFNVAFPVPWIPNKNYTTTITTNEDNNNPINGKIYMEYTILGPSH